MKILSRLALVGVGTLAGLAAGYTVFKADDKSCQARYDRKISELEEQFKDVQAPAGVAGLKDFTMEYVISKEAGFKGVVFKDALSGKEGVVTKVPFLGQMGFGMQYAALDQILQSPSAAVPIQPQVRLYVPGKGGQ